MDIGIWVNRDLLHEKLDQAETNKPEAVWNLSRWPEGFSEEGPHRLFVATDGEWIGYFLLSTEALYLPEDNQTPYGLLFDTRTWTEIAPIPVKCFRGFTYKVPKLSVAL